MTSTASASASAPKLLGQLEEKHTTSEFQTQAWRSRYVQPELVELNHRDSFAKRLLSRLGHSEWRRRGFKWRYRDTLLEYIQAQAVLANLENSESLTANPFPLGKTKSESETSVTEMHTKSKSKSAEAASSADHESQNEHSTARRTKLVLRRGHWRKQLARVATGWVTQESWVVQDEPYSASPDNGEADDEER